MEFWNAVASAKPCKQFCTSLQTDNHANTSSLIFHSSKRTINSEGMKRSLQQEGFVTGLWLTIKQLSLSK